MLVSHDVIIIGGGPAALTAAIYASREGLNTVLLEKMLCGGRVALTAHIENWPGTPDGTVGADLMEKIKQQAQKFGTQITEFAEVTKVEPREKAVRIVTDNASYIGKTLIVATGSVPKKLNVPGEDKFYGKGLSYCATCDGPFYKGKDVAVIGCGDSGLQEGESLLGFVKTVTFIAYRPFMKARQILQERVKKKPNAKFLLNHIVTSINGDKTVASITAKEQQTGKEQTIDVQGIFVYIGFLPNTNFLQGVVNLDPAGCVITDDNMQTSIRGIYAAGDVRSKKIRQITNACGEGTIAAIAARDYIKEL
ncbi:MAG: thioredoxin-disulfide reductase [Planctomycetota bacterium]|nr:thioredoxin-disulfide reductase [Planctomycetota bacterium]